MADESKLTNYETFINRNNNTKFNDNESHQLIPGDFNMNSQKTLRWRRRAFWFDKIALIIQDLFQNIINRNT